MINDALANRMNAYVPEVLLVVEDTTRAELLNFINASAVSIDFNYIMSMETADDVISKSLSQQTITVCNNFIQNVNRFGKQCDPDKLIIRDYYPEGIIEMLHNDSRFKCLIALAYLNAAHASLIAAQIPPLKEPRNANDTNTAN